MTAATSPSALASPMQGATPARFSVFGMPIHFRFRYIHLVQLSVHLSIFAYWSVYFAPTREYMATIAALVTFAFFTDAITSFGRYKSWICSTGPIPVVTSANLFVWYRGQDVWMAFCVVFIGVAAKHVLQRNGRHIFNPSAIGVCVMALPCLIWPGRFGEYDIGHALNTMPNASEWILLVSAISLLNAPVVMVSIGAALGSLIVGPLQAPFFAHQYLPQVWWAPILLGITLLVTDPVTTPRTQSGRLLFGAAYMIVFAFLGAAMNETSLNNFWAKILPVALLNPFAFDFDRLPKRFAWLEPRWLSEKFNRAHVALWLAGMIAALVAFDLKPNYFEADIHRWNHTALLHQHGDDLPSCDDNPLFCKPFTFAAEISAWFDHKPENAPQSQPLPPPKPVAQPVATAEFVVPGGREARIEAMLCPPGLPDACACGEVSIRGATIDANYACGATQQTLHVGHIAKAAADATRTKHFALTGLPAGSPLLAAVTQSVQAKEGDWQWASAGGPPQQPGGQAAQLLHDGKLPEALDAYATLARSAPQPPAEALSGIEEVLTAMAPDIGQVEKLVQAADAKPSDPVAAFTAGVAAHHLGHLRGYARSFKETAYKQAVALLQKTLPAWSQQAAVHRYLAVCLARLGQKAEALQHIQQAAQLAPDNVELRLARAEVLFRQNPQDAKTRQAALADVDAYLKATAPTGQGAMPSDARVNVQRLRQQLMQPKMDDATLYADPFDPSLVQRPVARDPNSPLAGPIGVVATVLAAWLFLLVWWRRKTALVAA